MPLSGIRPCCEGKDSPSAAMTIGSFSRVFFISEEQNTSSERVRANEKRRDCCDSFNLSNCFMKPESLGISLSKT
jgi:hypothetical protein